MDQYHRTTVPGMNGRRVVRLNEIGGKLCRFEDRMEGMVRGGTLHMASAPQNNIWWFAEYSNASMV